MDLSIIIVNWNSRDYLKKCLESIVSQTKGIEFEVIVIDGGSFDGCAEMLAENFPQVHFIQSEENLGFAKANNRAFKTSTGENLLFLNPDTEIESNAFPTLLKSLRELPEAGAVGPHLLNSDRSVQSTSIRVFPSIISEVLDSDALQKRFPHLRFWNIAPLYENSQAPSEVDAVSGACLMIKRDVFERIGMFSEQYFMYSEDIDLCYKVMKANRKTYYVPGAVVTHHGGGSSSKSDVGIFSNVLMLESRFRFFKKTRTRWYCLIYRMSMFIAGVGRFLLLAAVWPFLCLRGTASSIEGSMKKWLARIRWALGLETWVKNY